MTLVTDPGCGSICPEKPSGYGEIVRAGSAKTTFVSGCRVQRGYYTDTTGRSSPQAYDREATKKGRGIRPGTRKRTIEQKPCVLMKGFRKQVYLRSRQPDIRANPSVSTPGGAANSRRENPNGPHTPCWHDAHSVAAISHANIICSHLPVSCPRRHVP